MSGVPYKYEVGDRVECIRGGWGIHPDHIGEVFVVEEIKTDIEYGDALSLTHPTIKGSWTSVREISVKPATKFTTKEFPFIALMAGDLISLDNKIWMKLNDHKVCDLAGMDCMGMSSRTMVKFIREFNCYHMSDMIKELLDK